MVVLGVVLEAVLEVELEVVLVEMEWEDKNIEGDSTKMR